MSDSKIHKDNKILSLRRYFATDHRLSKILGPEEDSQRLAKLLEGWPEEPQPSYTPEPAELIPIGAAARQKREDALKRGDEATVGRCDRFLATQHVKTRPGPTADGPVRLLPAPPGPGGRVILLPPPEEDSED